MGSSASGVVFNNGFEFSSANPQTVPLLAINIPVGLRFRDTPGAIVNASSVTQVIEGTTVPVGLAVPPGQTLAMVRGDLIFNNGFASAFSGNIQLGSARSGFCKLQHHTRKDRFRLYKCGRFWQHRIIRFIGGSGRAGGGAIALRGGNVTLRDRSSLISDTIGSIDAAASRSKQHDLAF